MTLVPDALVGFVFSCYANGNPNLLPILYFRREVLKFQCQYQAYAFLVFREENWSWYHVTLAFHSVPLVSGMRRWSGRLATVTNLRLVSWYLVLL
jgi:hypothetical protein